MSKISFPTANRKTRKGVKPNHSGEKLVNIASIDEDIVERVTVSVAKNRVSSGLWVYCPKKVK